MTKVTNIPSRLHSVEQGNIVAGANEVYDDTKGKKQNVINSETDAELLRLEQTKQDNLTFDNAPTENSNNPVKSGGVYAADLALQQAIEAILLLIPSAATAVNQLADKAFVNSSISTATATFRGTYNVVTDLHLAVDATHAQIEAALASVVATADNNDYCFVQTPVSSSSQDIQKTSRYKFNGTAWVFEYDLNTSGFTSAQWAAINSGITAALVTKLGDLPYASELSADLSALSGAIGDEETRAKGVEQGLSTAIQGILGLIPSEATSSNQLADKTYVTNLINAITALIPTEATDQNQLADKAYVLARILAATPAFKGQFTTLADLQDVQNPKAGDLGIVRTTDSDGYAVFTFYQYLNNQWNVYFTLSHHNQKKPATTGTTGYYPYNGMGRIVLDRDVDFKTQIESLEYASGNYIFVIQYDFTLTGNVTIPINCVLQFEGGSISDDGTHTISGTPMIVNESNKQIFDNVNIDMLNDFANVLWFGAKGDNSTDNTTVFNQVLNRYRNILIPNGVYLTGTINLTEGFDNVSRHIKGEGLYSSPSLSKTNKSITRLVNTGSDYLIKCDNSLTLNYTTIERICFDIPTTCEGALYLNNIYYCTFKYLYVLGNGKTSDKNIGIYVNGVGFNDTFDQIIISYVNKGIVFHSSGSSDWVNTVSIGVGNKGSVYIGSATVGIEVQKGGVFISGAVIENCDTAIKYDDTNNLNGYIQSNVENSYFESNTLVFDIISSNRTNKRPIIGILTSEFHSNTSLISKTNDSYVTILYCDGITDNGFAPVIAGQPNSSYNISNYPYKEANNIILYKSKAVTKQMLSVISDIGARFNNFDAKPYTSVKSSTMFVTYIPKIRVDQMIATPSTYYQSLVVHESGYTSPSNDGMYIIRLIIKPSSDANAKAGNFDLSDKTMIVDLYFNKKLSFFEKKIVLGETTFNSIFSNFSIQWAPGSGEINIVLGMIIQNAPATVGGGFLIHYEVTSYGLYGLESLCQNFGGENEALARTNAIGWADSFYDWTIADWIWKDNNSRIWKNSSGTTVYDFTNS